eukprot:TRINITY_DN10677_c0_g2_i2.p1 TRINITY_DN10677_c0_g2~~TRINITY_DN10677_c0_g2_i2.p1  ORF type:complete len:201 (+),score=41.00 TRINITY_DN10677_c0_g2_i2:131-733(+)
MNRVSKGGVITPPRRKKRAIHSREDRMIASREERMLVREPVGGGEEKKVRKRTKKKKSSTRSEPFVGIAEELQRKMDEYLEANGGEIDSDIDINDESIPLVVRLSALDRDFQDTDYEVLLSLDDSINRSASKEAINSIPEFKARSRIHTKCNCSICLSPFKVRQNLKKLPCSHTFHSQCLDRWLSEYNKFCPLCKYSIPS